MIIKIIKHYIFFLIMFFSLFNFAQASVFINEVKISPTGERFIELYNSGSSSVDLTNWYIQRKTTSGSDFGSLVSKPNFEGKSINAGGYFLISRSEMLNTDIIVGNLTLTESNTIQIKNSEGNVVDKIGWGDVSDCENICALNPTDGKSIQRISNGNWIIATPTPRSVNSSTDSSTGLNDNTDTTGGTVNTTTNTSSSSSKEDTSEILKITTKIISLKIVTTGIPFSLSSLTTTNRGQVYNVGKFVWNFGDGMVSEKGKSNPFDYVYEYPGEYALTLSYFNSYLSKEADATDKIIIKVIPSEIFISGVGNNTDPFTELENKSNYEIILSNWIVTAGMHYFIIPEGTILLPNKKIKLSPKITGFMGDDMNLVTITNTNKEIVATYPIIKTQKSIQKNTSTYAIAQNDVFPVDNNLQNNSSLKDSQTINLNDLGASAGDVGVNIPSSIYPIVGLLIVIGVGVASFLLIKKRRDVGDYVEKGISANDMTIIE